MSNEKVLVNKSDLVSLANSVRTKAGEEDKLTISAMKMLIDAIPVPSPDLFMPVANITKEGLTVSEVS